MNYREEEWVIRLITHKKSASCEMKYSPKDLSRQHLLILLVSATSVLSYNFDRFYTKFFLNDFGQRVINTKENVKTDT